MQYEHIVPHSLGGRTDAENMIISCGPCNYGKDQFRLEDLNLVDPRTRKPIRSDWDGLERIMQPINANGFV